MLVCSAEIVLVQRDIAGYLVKRDIVGWLFQYIAGFPVVMCSITSCCSYDNPGMSGM